MNGIKMMAVRITRTTWPIAVACLPHGFASLPYRKVRGAYLIINVPTARYFREAGESPLLVIENEWCDEEEFLANYEFVTGEVEDEFVSVRKI